MHIYKDKYAKLKGSVNMKLAFWFIIAHMNTSYECIVTIVTIGILINLNLLSYKLCVLSPNMFKGVF